MYRDIFLHELGAVIIEEKVQEIPPAIMQQLVIHLVDEHLWKVCLLNDLILGSKSRMARMNFFLNLIGRN